MRELPHTRSCYVCGETNPLGLRLRFHTDGRGVRAQFVPKPEHCGFAGVVHGGVLATLLDEIMVWACAVGARQFAFCAELTTRFHQPARPGEILTIEAELVADRRGKSLKRRPWSSMPSAKRWPAPRANTCPSARWTWLNCNATSSAT